MKLRISGIQNDSIVDGPGIRLAVFTQGCPHHCEGCHNPQTWDFEGGRLVDTKEIFDMIIKNPLLDGVTFSGGEPFCQCKALAELARMIRRNTKLNIMSYTGFEYEYLVSHSTDENGYGELLDEIDRLMDGRFVLAERSLDLKFRGSRNQRFIDVKKSRESGSTVLVKDEWDDIEIKLL